MRINSVNNANFKGIYLVLGLNPERKSFKEECEKYPKKMAYIPITRDKIKIIKEDNTSFYNLINGVYINCMRKKPALLVTGNDFKKYKDGKEGFRNSDELIKGVNGIIDTPLFDTEGTVKEMAKKDPDKFVKWWFVK